MSRFMKGCLLGCGLFVLLAVAGIIGGVQWMRTTFTGPPPAAPKIGPNVALRPTFPLRKGGAFAAGTAVAVRLKPDQKPVLLTALHLFGPAGGLEKDLAPSEIERVVAGVSLTNMAGKRVGTARSVLRKTGSALRDDTRDVSQDVAAFGLMPGAKVNALSLAAENPRMGEWLWLVGDVYNHRPQSQRLFPARVLVVADTGTAVKFEEEFPLQAFSGAPLINSRREVAGLLIAGGPGTGIVHPAGSIRRRLRESGL